MGYRGGEAAESEIWSPCGLRERRDARIKIMEELEAWKELGKNTPARPPGREYCKNEKKRKGDIG